MKSFVLILTVFLFSGCASSKLKDPGNLAEKNKDVSILALLIQDHLRATNERPIDLNELLQKDSLKRISNNFKSIELKSRGGHMAVYYQFSDKRKVVIDLNGEEKQRLQ